MAVCHLWFVRLCVSCVLSCWFAAVSYHFQALSIVGSVFCHIPLLCYHFYVPSLFTRSAIMSVAFPFHIFATILFFFFCALDIIEN